MSTETLRTEIINLERKVKILLSEHANLKQENNSVQKENESLRAKLAQHESRLSDFQNQSKISRIVESMVVDGNETTELKEVIDDYIKEIDKCIAHLDEG